MRARDRRRLSRFVGADDVAEFGLYWFADDIIKHIV